MVYKYEWGAKKYPVPAQQAGEYLQGISERENGVTAERLLELSKDDTALMHNCFTWDNTRAAEKYRLYESRKIIQSLVAVEINEKPVERQRAIVSVTSTAHSEKGVFKPIIEALTSEESRSIVLSNAVRDVKAFTEKYRNLEELADVLHEMDKFIEGRAS